MSWLERRGEVGAAVCAWHEGERVVDLWGGLADRDSEEPWGEDTLSVIFSSSAGLAPSKRPDRGEKISVTALKPSSQPTT